jgi:hypothetical protein
MQKLRKEVALYYKDMMTYKTKRVCVTHTIEEPSIEKKNMIEEIIKNKKMTINPEKLVKTIDKAAVPIPKKGIVVLDFLPKHPTSETVVKKVETRICQAKNLNGTPCKCRAKIGQFCAKHAP